MPAHWIQYEGKDGANVLKERTQNRRALDGFVYPKNKNAPAQAWELVCTYSMCNVYSLMCGHRLTYWRLSTPPSTGLQRLKCHSLPRKTS